MLQVFCGGALVSDHVFHVLLGKLLYASVLETPTEDIKMRDRDLPDAAVPAARIRWTGDTS